MIEFGGFSSEEEEEGEVPKTIPSDPPVPVPPDQTQENPLFLPLATKDATPTKFSSPNQSLCLPDPAVQPVTLPTTSLPVPECLTQHSQGTRGGDRGGGRSQLCLPLGCEVVLTESGAENYICCCKKSFTEKKNLLRHHQACLSNKERPASQPVQPGCKRRRPETGAESAKSESTEPDDYQVHGDTVTKAHFNEDLEGTKLMQCK